MHLLKKNNYMRMHLQIRASSVADAFASLLCRRSSNIFVFFLGIISPPLKNINYMHLLKNLNYMHIAPTCS